MKKAGDKLAIKVKIFLKKNIQKMFQDKKEMENVFVGQAINNCREKFQCKKSLYFFAQA